MGKEKPHIRRLEWGYLRPWEIKDLLPVPDPWYKVERGDELSVGEEREWPPQRYPLPEGERHVYHELNLTELRAMGRQ
jgi:hypothetical protein